MKALLGGRERNSKSIAISIAVHVVLFAGLSAITFRYPIEEYLNRSNRTPTPPPVRFIRLTPKPPVASGVSTARSSARVTPPSAMPVAQSIPTAIPAPSVPTSPSGAIRGGISDTTRSVSVATGIQPGIPSSRLSTNPASIGALPLTHAQQAERALSAIYNEYLDSVKVARANPRRAAGDWSWGGKDGEKWGWDANGIHIGGITIPNLVLAALPLNVGPTGRNMNALIDGRTDAYMRADIKLHGDAMSEDEFRQAIKRIRERVDRERREKMEKAKPKPPPCCN